MKVLALDIGDKWTGIAISDATGMIARPYDTAETSHLEVILTDIFNKEPISKIVVGHPKTLRGTESDQTRKTITYKKKLESLYPDKKWILWDERLSSKQASSLKKTRTKNEKKRSHAIAAALILETYLLFSHS